MEDSKLGKEGLTIHEKVQLARDITNAGLNIATNLNPIGAWRFSDLSCYFSGNPRHGGVPPRELCFVGKGIEDQYEFQNGNTFKAIPVESAGAVFVEELT